MLDGSAPISIAWSIPTSSDDCCGQLCAISNVIVAHACDEPTVDVVVV